MQKGFASIEIIFAVLIISLLATVAVPNAARFVDRAALDYEQKRLYSELQFVRTFDRTINFPTIGLSDYFPVKKPTSNLAELEFNRTAHSYRILHNDEVVREPHYLSNGVTFANETNIPDKIRFDTAGYANSEVKSKSIVLSSRRGDSLKIVFDSVGRIRGSK